MGSRIDSLARMVAALVFVVLSSPAMASSTPAFRAVTVELRLDGHSTIIAGVESRLRADVQRASASLQAHFGFALEVGAVGQWTTPVGAEEIDALHDVAKADLAARPSPADLVLSYTAIPHRGPAREDEWMRAHYADRSIILRSHASRVDPALTEQLVNLEAFAIARAVGIIFGGLQLCGDAFMDPQSEARFSLPRPRALTSALISAHLTLELMPDGELRPTETAARAALAVLRSIPERIRRCAGHTAQRRVDVLTDWVSRHSAAVSPEPDVSLSAAARTASAEGQAALMAGDPVGALTKCRPAAERSPGSPAGRCAGLAAFHVGDFAEAARFLRAFLGESDRALADVDAELLLARALGRAGDDGAARALMVRLVKRHPKHVDTLMNLGIAEARLGRYRAARRAWEDVTRFGAASPSSPEAHREALTLLSQLPKAR